MVSKKVCVGYVSLYSFSILALFCCSACDSRSMIAHGLTGREANEIVVLLVSKGVSAQKVPQVAGSSGGGSSEQLWDISVPAAQITEALAMWVFVA